MTSRRDVCRWALAGPALALATLTRPVSAQTAAGACRKLESLPASQRSLRAAIGFKVQTDDDRKCASCAFFTADSAEPDCGQCSLLGGGAVHATSVCNSWAGEE